MDEHQKRTVGTQLTYVYVIDACVWGEFMPHVWWGRVSAFGLALRQAGGIFSTPYIVISTTMTEQAALVIADPT